MFPSTGSRKNNGESVKRLLICLILVLTNSGGQGADVDLASIETWHFDALFAHDYQERGVWRCCEESQSLAFADVQYPCAGDGIEACVDELLNTDFRDRKGLKRDTFYFLGFQFASLGVLYVMPESISSWSDEDKEDYSLSKWWHNVTHPTWDQDDFFLNYVTHPYWGAAYFVRARERGYGNSESFWYSAMLSSMYEFGVEALFEPASVQDLIVTPVFGSLLGYYFMGVRENIEDRAMERGYRTTKDKWLLVLTDPLGSINHQLDSWLGMETALHMGPYMQPSYRTRDTISEPVSWNDDGAIGLAFTLHW